MQRKTQTQKALHSKKATLSDIKKAIACDVRSTIGKSACTIENNACAIERAIVMAELRQLAKSIDELLKQFEG